jgi:hypothetical protein
VVGEIGPLDRDAEALPEPVVVGAEHEMAVGGLHGLVGRRHAVRRADAARHAAGAPVFGDVPDREGDAGVEERGVDVLALAGRLAADVGGEDGVDREERAADVGDRHARLCRRRVRLAGDRHDARRRLGDQVEARPLRPGPDWPKPEIEA